MESLFVPLSLLAGGLLAIQAGANTQLSKATGSPFVATTFQVVVAAVLLAIVAALTGTLGAFGRLPDVPWWHVSGGIATAFYVAATIILFPRLGAIVTVGLYIAGQMVASLALDTLGLFGVARQEPDVFTTGGAVAVLAGAAAIVVGQKGATSDVSWSKLGWIALALIAGGVLPMQGAVNGLLRGDIGAPFVVGTINFIVATITMVAVLLIMAMTRRGPEVHLGGLSVMPWWGWLGGFGGATYVTTVFSAIPVIGAAAAVGLTVAGQQIASAFVDRYGWFRLPQRSISALRLLGVVILLAGVALIQVF